MASRSSTFVWGRMLEEVRDQCRELRRCIDLLVSASLRNRKLRDELPTLLAALDGIVENLRQVTSGNVDRIARQVTRRTKQAPATDGDSPATQPAANTPAPARARATGATKGAARGATKGTVAAKDGLARKPMGMCILKGTSPEFAIPSLFQFLERNSKTGVLRMAMNGETIHFELVDGEIVHAITDRRPEEERLGTLLVARGAITPEELDEFLDKADGRAMGEAMNADQLVSTAELQAALSQQIQMLFSRVFSAAGASFWFYEGTRRRRELPARCNVVQLLLESARANDERNRDRSRNG